MLRRRTPDFAVLHPGYGPMGSHRAHYENLRVLRSFVVRGCFRYVLNSRSKRRQESSSRLGRTHFAARAQCRCNLR